MPHAPLSPNEEQRLAAIKSSVYLKRKRDAWMDSIVEVAKEIAGCPIALVTIVEEHRQWFLGCSGLDISGTPREQAFCAYTILSQDPLVVEDAAKDSRFKDNPLVIGEPRIRFYAGVPIFDDQLNALGSLCVIDTEPRKPPQNTIDALQKLASLINLQISSSNRHDEIMGAALDAIVTINSKGIIIEFNEPACRMFGYELNEALGSELADLIIPPSLRDAHHAGMAHYFKTGEGPVLGKRIEVPAYHSSGREFPVELAISPLTIAGERCFTAFIRDLSESHELNAKLRLMGFSIDSARDMVFWVSPDASFAYVNDAACEQLGYAREELLGMRVFDIDIMLPESSWQEHWAELRDRKAFTLESTHKSRGGRVFPVNVGCNYIEHEGKEYNCVIARDMSDYVAAKHALETSEERFRDIADAAGEYIWETDPSGVYTFVSGSIEDQLGAPAASVIATSIYENRPEEDAAELRATLSRAAANREPFQNLEFRCTHVDGGPRWQRLSGKALLDADGTVIGFRGMGLDVTQFKVAGMQSRRLADLQAIARSTASGFLERDNLENACAYLLSSTAQHLDADRAYILAHTDETIESIHAWQADGSHRDLPNDLTLGDTSLFTQIPDGDTKCAISITIPIDTDDQIQVLYEGCGAPNPLDAQETDLLIGIVRGMGQAMERTRRKVELLSATQQLEHALELAEQASRSKSAFLAHMSHELRTPLTSVLGFTEILQQGALTTEQRDTLLSRIHNSGSALLSIINSILDLSKIESDTLEIRTESASVSVVIRSAANTVIPTMNNAGLDFSIYIGEGVPESCLLDPVRVFQILTNLLNNAANYTDVGSVKLTVEGSGGVLRFLITDTGKGIAPNMQANIFEAFDRGSEGPESSGTGLGLAIVRRLVSLMEGTISVTSNVGEGSEFTIGIPVRDASEAMITPGVVDLNQTLELPQQSTVVSKQALEGVTILLVEDSPMVSEVVEYFLKDRGAHVVTRINGQEAIDTLIDDQLSVDIVLMDMQMPVLDGYQATRVLRQQRYRKPIIALTAHGLQHDRERCIAAGCDDYISKPVDPELLASACLRWATASVRAVQSSSREVPAEDSGIDPMQELRDRYRVHLREEAVQLAHQPELTDVEAIRKRVHKLAGSAGNFGFTQVTEAARACETAIRSGDDDETIARLLGALIDAINAGLTESTD